MTTTQTIRLSDPAELVAILPSQLGFTPVESIVLVSLRPPGSRVGMMMRVDLAQLAGPNGPLAAAGLTRVLLDDDASAILAAIYGSPRFGRAELSRLVQPLLDQFRQADLPYSVWLASDDAVERFKIAAVRAKRDRSAPKQSLYQRHRPANAAPLEALLPTVSVAAKRSARRATRRALDARLDIETASLGDWRLAGLELFLKAAAAYQAAGQTSPPPTIQPVDLGRLAALLADPIGRDSVMVATVGTSPDWARDMARGDWQESGDLPEEINQLLNPLTAPDVPAYQVAAAEAVLCLVAAHATAQRRPAALDLLAWLAWWKGDAVQAHRYLEAAEAGSNEPPLGDLVRSALAAGLLPRPRWETPNESHTPKRE